MFVLIMISVMTDDPNYPGESIVEVFKECMSECIYTNIYLPGWCVRYCANYLNYPI